MNRPFLQKSWFFALSFLVLGLVSATQAADEKIPELKTVSGKTFRDVRITKVTPTDVSIIHEGGAARIQMIDLPENLKAKLGYDPAKAEAHAKTTANEEKQAAEAAKKRAENEALKNGAKPMTFIVDKASGGGLLAWQMRLDSLGAWRVHDEVVKTGGGNYEGFSLDFTKYRFLEGVPNQGKLVHNIAIGGLFAEVGIMDMPDGTRIKKFRFVGLSKEK